MRSLYIKGCSLAYGYELGDHLPESERDQYRIENCYATRLMNRIRSHGFTGQLINASWSGVSNDWIWRTSVDDLVKLRAQVSSPADVFVIISWTGSSRREFWSERHQDYMTFLSNMPPKPDNILNPEIEELHDLYYRHFSNEKADNDMFLTQALTMKGFLESEGFPYLFTWGISHPMGGRAISKDPRSLRLRDKHCYYEPNHGSFWAMSSRHGYAEKGRHPNEFGHSMWADLLYHHLISNNLI